MLLLLLLGLHGFIIPGHLPRHQYFCIKTKSGICLYSYCFISNISPLLA